MFTLLNFKVKKFSLDFGWFANDNFSLLEIEIFDKIEGLISIFRIKIAKLIFSINIDEG